MGIRTKNLLRNQLEVLGRTYYTTSILLMGHSIKPTPNDFFFFASPIVQCISQPYQRNLFFRSFTINPENNKWSTIRESVTQEFSGPIEHLYHTHSFQISGIIVEECIKSLKEPEEVGDYEERVFSMHNRAVAHMNSQWICWHTQNLCNSSQAKFQH